MNMLTFGINADQLRKALAEIEAAEANGFMHCRAIFDITQAGSNLDQCIAEYSDLSERAHPYDPSLNCGRFQGVTRRNKFVDGKLVPIKPTPQ